MIPGICCPEDKMLSVNVSRYRPHIRGLVILARARFTPLSVKWRKPSNLENRGMPPNERSQNVPESPSSRAMASRQTLGC